ncbi:MAG: Kelch repeat-containing protein [Candidatus Kryptoniota bacterium]
MRKSVRKYLTVVIGLAYVFLSNNAFSQTSVVPDMPRPRFGMCAVRIDNRAYFIGGTNGGVQNLQQGMQYVRQLKPTAIVDAFDFQTMKWDTTIAPLLTPRIFADAVVVDDSIYVIGGLGPDGEVLKTVEVYDKSTNSWHYTAPMLLARYGASAVVWEDQIFVLGGAQGGMNSLLSEVESYNPQRPQWEKKASLNVERAFHKSVGTKSGIYIFNGITTYGPLNIVEKYDPNRGSVVVKVTVAHPRIFFSTVRDGDSVFIISGLSSDYSERQDVEFLNLTVDGEESDSDLRNVILDMPRLGAIAEKGMENQIYLFGGISSSYRSGTLPVPYVSSLTITPVKELKDNTLPEGFQLYQNYPNPFNPSTRIDFDVPSPGASVEIAVYNILGQKIANLINGYLQGGHHSINFNGNMLPSGTYFYEMQSNGTRIVRRMVLLK